MQPCRIIPWVFFSSQLNLGAVVYAVAYEYLREAKWAEHDP